MKERVTVVIEPHAAPSQAGASDAVCNALWRVIEGVESGAMSVGQGRVITSAAREAWCGAST